MLAFGKTRTGGQQILAPRFWKTDFCWSSILKASVLFLKELAYSVNSSGLVVKKPSEKLQNTKKEGSCDLFFGWFALRRDVTLVFSTSRQPGLIICPRYSTCC